MRRGHSALVTGALIIVAIRIWMQIRGKAKTPFREWIIGWGALFFMLSLLAEVAPGAAGTLSLMVALTDFLANGVGLTDDISKIVTGAEKGDLFIDKPFAAAGSPATMPAGAHK